MVNGTTTRLSTLMITLTVPTISKRPKEILTGCTLQGLQQGIPDKEAGNGEKIYGVAPEAQVMFMRVFSDRQKQLVLLFM